MLYSVIHTTSYDYDEAITYCHNIAILKPRDFLGQQLVDYSLEIQPFPSYLEDDIDFFNNTISRFSIEQSHNKLVVTATSLVERNFDLQPNIFTSETCKKTTIKDALNELKPDLIIVLGDRFEIFAAVATALVARIPVAHLHGGETTEGVIDEAIRHSITKMAHLHFVAADEYKQRVIQLGEQPEYVFLVGGLGIDNLKNLKLLDRNELERDLGFKFAKKTRFAQR